MPSSLVHYIFAKSSKSEANSAYCLGSQGPDPFFYYGYTSIKAKNTKTTCNLPIFLFFCHISIKIDLTWKHPSGIWFIRL